MTALLIKATAFVLVIIGCIITSPFKTASDEINVTSRILISFIWGTIVVNALTMSTSMSHVGELETLATYGITPRPALLGVVTVTTVSSGCAGAIMLGAMSLCGNRASLVGAFHLCLLGPMLCSALSAVSFSTAFATRKDPVFSLYVFLPCTIGIVLFLFYNDATILEPINVIPTYCIQIIQAVTSLGTIAALFMFCVRTKPPTTAIANPND